MNTLFRGVIFQAPEYVGEDSAFPGYILCPICLSRVHTVLQFRSNISHVFSPFVCQGSWGQRKEIHLRNFPWKVMHVQCACFFAFHEGRGAGWGHKFSFFPLGSITPVCRLKMGGRKKWETTRSSTFDSKVFFLQTRTDFVQ